MKEIKFAVTSNKNDNRKMIIQAKSWAEELQVPYAPRYENGSLDAMLEDFQLDALLIASKKGPQIYTKEGMLFYHPGLGKVRWQRVMQRHENDNFLTALNVRPGQRVLDCTVGLAADALLASCAVGEAGKVVGLEASLPLWFLTSRGFRLTGEPFRNLPGICSGWKSSMGKHPLICGPCRKTVLTRYILIPCSASPYDVLRK
ncbi:MAG: hypothetical protein J6M57_05470 [Acidaminococcaceae bacterium]|nr:hypothetical protein [Acidaminococcaceae bacterium]